MNSEYLIDSFQQSNGKLLSRGKRVKAISPTLKISTFIEILYCMSEGDLTCMVTVWRGGLSGIIVEVILMRLFLVCWMKSTSSFFSFRAGLKELFINYHLSNSENLTIA